MKKVIVLLMLLSVPLVAFSNRLSEMESLMQRSHQSAPFNDLNIPEKIASEIRSSLQSAQADDLISVIVTLKDQANLNNFTRLTRTDRINSVVKTLQTKADTGQQKIRDLIETRRSEGKVSQVTYFWIFNGLEVTATPDVIQELAARPDVLHITPNESFQAPPFLPLEQGEIGVLSVQPNLTLINIPTLWDFGYQGEGIVVANMDTGVDVSHPNLSSKWRGGTNSWFDPYGQHPTTPVDLASGSSGHGTQTMGIMVGGEDGGVAFGIAPAAKWIAVKIFKDDGSATAAGVHAGFQWLLDPDGIPGTADTPHVVNNSWTAALGCNLEFQLDLQALRAIGILPIFAAGNFGPTASTSASPANYPEAFAVGAINNSSVIKLDSSRGSSACDGTIFPEVVAPGVSVHTTDLYGFYTNASGTSFAAPHVAGGLALLLDSYPALTLAEQENALLNSTVDLGAGGPDNTYGQGRIDFFAALQSISADLAITQTVSSSSINSLDIPLTYTLTITNSGPMTTTGVVLTDTLPASALFGSVSYSQGNCTLADASTVSCTLGIIGNGGTATATIVVTPTVGGTLINTAQVEGTRPDINLENNTATANTTAPINVYLPIVIK